MQEKMPQNFNHEMKFAIGCKYSELSREEKRRMVEYITSCCGDSVGTWLQRFSHWARKEDFQCRNTFVLESAHKIVMEEAWRQQNN